MIQDAALSLPWVWEQTVGSVLDRTAELYPDRDALVFPGLKLRWSWRELNQRVNRIASGLIALGVEPGQHVGIWSMNVPEWMVTQFAAGRIGAVLVNVNPAYRLHELEDALADGRRGDAHRRQPVQGLGLRGDGRVALPRGGGGEFARLGVRAFSSIEEIDRAGRAARPWLVDLDRP